MNKFSATTQNTDINALILEFDPASDGWFLYGYEIENDTPTLEIWHMSKEDAIKQASDDYGVGTLDWSEDGKSDETPTRDCNGAALNNGDTVTVIKDLDVKGAGATVKRGTTIKNISLTNDPELIDCRTKEIKGLVLKTCFVKKI